MRPFVFPSTRQGKNPSKHIVKLNNAHQPVWIKPDAKKEKFRVRVPNVRSWAVGVTESLADLVRVEELPEVRIHPKETPPEVHVRPVVGGRPEAVMTLEEVRKEWPLLRTAFLMAEELFDEVSLARFATWGVMTGLMLGVLAVVTVGPPRSGRVASDPLLLSAAAMIGITAALGAVAAIGSAVFFRLVARWRNPAVARPQA